jgi:uncharacterized membrane protein (UPF0127 family)
MRRARQSGIEFCEASFSHETEQNAKMFSRFPALLPVGIALLALLTSCGGRKAGEEAKTIADHFPIKVGERTVLMQVAALPDEMEHGLMFRDALAADEGMIFVFGEPQPMSFWMRNTKIPLDIGYFDAGGELKEIYPLYAYDERSVKSRGHNLQFALEMNQGWYRQNGVKPGAKLDLKALAEALRARGLKPEAVGVHLER